MKKIKLIACAASTALLALALSGCASDNEAQPEAPSETLLAVYDVYDTSEGVAATVNGVEIGEKSVTSYVEAKREAFGLTDDAAWEEYLASSQLTPETLRSQIIDQYVEDEGVRQAAEANGIEVTEEEVDAAYQNLKDEYGNESAWRIFLKQTGQTEYEVREAQRMSLLKKKLYYLATGTSELEDLVDDITSQMLSSAGTSDKLEELQEEQANLPENASPEEREQLQAQITEEQQKVQETYASAQELVSLIDRGINKMKEAMGAEVYEVTDEEILDYLKSSDPSLETLDSLDAIPSSLIAYFRNQLVSQKQSDAAAEFIAEYTEDADIVVNDAPEGLSYFIVMTPAAAQPAADAAAQ